jgi:hypothetical protein
MPIHSKFLGAFNKVIAAKLRKHVRSDDQARHTTIATMHSGGYAAWRQRHPEAAVLKDKAREVFRQLAGERSFDHRARYADYVGGTVSYAINAGVGLDDPREVEDDTRW